MCELDTVRAVQRSAVAWPVESATKEEIVSIAKVRSRDEAGKEYLRCAAAVSL